MFLTSICLIPARNFVNISCVISPNIMKWNDASTPNESWRSSSCAISLHTHEFEIVKIFVVNSMLVHIYPISKETDITSVEIEEYGISVILYSHPFLHGTMFHEGSASLTPISKISVKFTSYMRHLSKPSPWGGIARAIL